MRILGVMTGTSCDSLDAACIEVTAQGWQPQWSVAVSYPPALRKRVFDAQKPGRELGVVDWLVLHRDLGDWYASSLGRILRGKRRASRPQVIAVHGQTIGHFPGKKMTLQLGEPARIVRETGLTVVTDFRNGDLAAGGRGAPLVPFFHRMMGRMIVDQELEGQGLSIHNIGGISNLTYLGMGQRVIAFDTGPGNLWIDAAADWVSGGKLKLDRNGVLARRGQPDQDAIGQILRHPYFRRAAPKSTGRDEFPFELLLKHTRAKGADLVATATAITVKTMALAYQRAILAKRLPLHAIYLCGGGAANPALIQGLQNELTQTIVKTLDQVGFDSKLVEAQAFAYYGFLALCGKACSGPWTGARGFVPPAHIIPGPNWVELVSTLHDSRFLR
ncbi:anhydro-N-acetylmuramic acid kinase [Bdellovibrionota bacterium FG-1]